MSQHAYVFRRPELLRQALTIPWANRPEPDNQRLEFLGDAVLQLLVSEKLYARHPEADEGRLTAMRARLVSGKALLQRAERLGTVFLDGLAANNIGKQWPPKAIADAVEAYFGAVWCDGGLPAVTACLKQFYTEADYRAVDHATDISDNPKGALQQFAQKHFHEQPQYTTLAIEGPMHAPTLRCSVSLLGETAEGTGTTRKAAEGQAARVLLARLTPHRQDTQPEDL